MQISVMLDNFRQPVEAALDTALALGIEAVQPSLEPDTDVEALTRTIAARGVTISAISCHVGDLGEDDWAPKVEAAKPLIEAAIVTGSSICQTHVGVMPHSASGPRWDNFVRACGGLADYAATRGACVALETGPEPAWVMERLMTTVNSPGLRVNYDPANLILWPAIFPKFPDLAEHAGKVGYRFERGSAEREFEPIEGVRRLAPFIAHVHAKDAIGDGGWADVPLGQGWIDWPHFLGLLKAGGFNGYLAIEREGGDDREGEIGAGVRFLRSHLDTLQAS